MKNLPFVVKSRFGNSIVCLYSLGWMALSFRCTTRRLRMWLKDKTFPEPLVQIDHRSVLSKDGDTKCVRYYLADEIVTYTEIYESLPQSHRASLRVRREFIGKCEQARSKIKDQLIDHPETLRKTVPNPGFLVARMFERQAGKLEG